MSIVSSSEGGTYMRNHEPIPGRRDGGLHVARGFRSENSHHTVIAHHLSQSFCRMKQFGLCVVEAKRQVDTGQDLLLPDLHQSVRDGARDGQSLLVRIAARHGR